MNSTARQRTAIVVGAGIGGLAAALALQRIGWQVRVLERTAVLQEVGAGLTISPNAARALAALGALTPLSRWLSHPPYQISEDPFTGQETGRLIRGPKAIEQYGAPYAFVHRADLHDTLTACVSQQDSACIQLGRTVVAARQNIDRASVQCADGSTLTADLVVGADGQKSSIRAALLGDASPRYTGFVAWRGLLALDQVPAAAIPVGSAVTFGVGKCFVRYRIEPRQVLNFVAFAEQAEWPGEEWTIPADPAVPAALFADWHPALSALWRAAPRAATYQWGLLDRDPIDHYDYERIALLGDAAHPMLPFLGQGAALALEDAVVLGRALQTYDDPLQALRHYNKARQPRGAAAQLESRAAALRMHGSGADPRTVNEETLDYFKYDAANVAV